MRRGEYDRLISLQEQFNEVMEFMTIPREGEMYSTSYVPRNPWGTGSLNVIATLEPNLVYLANGLGDVYNCSAIWGYRGELIQTAMFEEGVGLPWPTSNHNVYPSRALDIVPYPTGYDDIPQLDMMLGAAEAIAARGGFQIRLGKYFSNVADYAHIELV